MTRFDGYRLLACPLCHTIHAAVNVVSFNFMADEHWSDSYSAYSLFENRQGLRKCTACHDFFLQSDAPYIGHLTSEQALHKLEASPAYIPPFMRATGARGGTTSHSSNDSSIGGRTWIQRLKQWWHSEPQHTQQKEVVNNEQPKNEDNSKKYPGMTSADDGDLAGILENQEKYSVSLLQATRILYWVHLNNTYRENARQLAKQGQLPHSAFNPSPTQIDNMRTLLALLEFADRGAREITIAELYRELGQFDRSIDILQKIDSPSLKSETILEAAKKGISAPVLIPYHGQQKK